MKQVRRVWEATDDLGNGHVFVSYEDGTGLMWPWWSGEAQGLLKAFLVGDRLTEREVRKQEKRVAKELLEWAREAMRRGRKKQDWTP